MTQPEIIRTIGRLRARVRAWRAAGETIALVPTMGALHDGHVSLVALARRRAARVVVSIFVNPAQFGPDEDFARYPRAFEADLAKLAAAGADAAFHPDAAEMYPPGFATSIAPQGPAAAGLEDRFRPTHFQGVATVVAKLLLQASPDAAIFGEKDFQQLAVIRRMVRDLDIPVEIVGAPTLREASGLALSSRNAYLDPAQRERAPALYRALRAAAERLRQGAALEPTLHEASAAIAAAGFEIDYVELRDAQTLGAPIAGQTLRDWRLLGAARIGATRLIDNVAVSD